MGDKKTGNGRGGRRPGSGRKKGNTNQVKKDLLKTLQENPLLKDYDPLMQMAVLGQTGLTENEVENYNFILEKLSGVKNKKVVEVIDHILLEIERAKTKGDAKLRANTEVASYVYSKRKAVEVSDPNGNNPFASLAESLSEAVKK